MPKLDNTHLSTRIERELERLKNGNALVVRNVKAVLSAEQWSAMEAAWSEQKQLHRGKRPRDEDQRKKLGMKNKRRIYIEALEKALAAANANATNFLRRAQTDAARRQIEIYTDAVKRMREQAKDMHVARNYANNELTRAGLNRLDRARRGMNRRDREVHDIEEQLRACFRGEMTADELEQEKMLERHQQWKER